MRKNVWLVIIFALAALLFTSGGPARAYTVTGDLSSSGTTAFASGSTYTGSLAGLFDTVSHEAVYIDNGSPSSDMYANQDYIVATSSSGAIATFSVGEITVGNNANSNITITGNSSTGYTISGPGQTLSNVTNINVVHTSMPAGTAGWSSSLSIKNGVTTTTYNAGPYPGNDPFPGSLATLTGAEDIGNSKNIYTGVSLLTLLNNAGVNMNNLNQYVIATGMDGGEVVLSMDEIVQNNGGTNVNGTTSDMVAYLDNGGGLASNRGYFRLILPTDTSTSRSVFTLTSLDVVPTPVPATLLLFAPGLAGIAAIRRRFKK